MHLEVSVNSSRVQIFSNFGPCMKPVQDSGYVEKSKEELDIFSSATTVHAAWLTIIESP